MKIEDFFNQQNVIELSFFNFENAITAAYFARENLEIVRVNDNFRKFFPVLGNVSNAYFPDVLVQLGVSVEQVEQFVRGQTVLPARHSLPTAPKHQENKHYSHFPEPEKIYGNYH